MCKLVFCDRHNVFFIMVGIGFVFTDRQIAAVSSQAHVFDVAYACSIILPSIQGLGGHGPRWGRGWAVPNATLAAEAS